MLRRSLGERELFLCHMLVVEWRILLVSGLGSKLDVNICESDEALYLLIIDAP